MNNRIISSFVASLVVAGIFSSAFAQETATGTSIAAHPRVSEIDSRLQNEQKRIDAGVTDGQINAKQEMHDENRMQKIDQQVSKDEAKHGGHLTKKEQKRLNGELNGNSSKIHTQRHDGVPANPATPVAPAAGTSN